MSNFEVDIGGGWTGSVPSTSPASPQSASIYIATGSWELDTISTFVGAPTNSPFIFNLGTVFVNNAMIRANSVNSSAGSYAYAIVTAANPTVIKNSTIWYNSQYNGAFLTINADNIQGVTQIFEDVYFKDDNTGTPAKPMFSINWGSNYYWQSYIKVLPFFDSQNRYFGGFPPSLQANPPASGTVYQNQNPTPIRILLPVYASTSGTAGSVSVAMGNNSSGTSPPTIPTIYTKFINGSTTSTSPEIAEVVVPAGWYYSFTGTGVTFGTATVLPA